ncbi:MAG: hypothetical protein GEV09_28165, partial [Pseudonocardiaceae bacterium]|nr:hypothetical protein [Pseudonocardiaceae bacterium]
MKTPPIAFAHRGARAHAPENTLEAFALALRLGATGLESDVWLTADGEAVLGGPVGHQGHPLDEAAQGLPLHFCSIAVIQGRPEGPDFGSPEGSGARMEADRRRRRFLALSGKKRPLCLQLIQPG